MSETERDAAGARKARIAAIVDTWPAFTPEQRTTLWHALAPMRAAITERRRQVDKEGGTDAAA